MPLAKVLSCAVVGLDGELVEVEVDVARGQVGFFIVGLPDTAVQEAKERVRSAIKNSGFEFPLRRLTVNLAPADLRKRDRRTRQVTIGDLRLPEGVRGESS